MEQFGSLWSARTRLGLFRFRLADDILTWANRGFADLFAPGASPETLVGKRFADLAGFGPPWAECRARLREKGEACGVVLSCRTGAGRERLVSLDAFLTGGPDQSEPSAEGSVRDLGEAGDAHRQAEMTRDHLQAMVASLGDALIFADPEGRVRWWNRQAEALTGWSEAEACGRPVTDCWHLVAEGTAGLVEDILGAAWRDGRPVELAATTVLQARDGRRCRIAGRVDPVRAAGAPLGVAILFRDVTTLAQENREREKARRLEALSRLAGGIAHDFNNIMTGLFGYIGLAQIDAPPGSRLAERLGKAEATLGKARGLSNQLLTFARARPPQKRAVVLADFLRQEVRNACLGTALTGEFAFPPDLRPVDLDESQFGPVVHALVGRAARARPTGGILRVAAANQALTGAEGIPLPSGRYLRVVFHDDGEPLPESALDQVFDPFSGSGQPDEGFELPLAYSIVKSHGGWLTVRPGAEGGTDFLLFLPPSCLLREDEPALPAVQGGLRGRILVMDDEDIIRGVVGDMLQFLGCTVELARDGDEAVALYRMAQEEGKGFDVVILDLTVPGGKGARLTLPLLLALDPRARVAVASGYSTGPVMAEYQKYGFIGAIAKPFEVKSLHAFLAPLLGAAAAASPLSRAPAP